MQVKGIVWLGAGNDQREEMTSFLTEHLGLTLDLEVPGFTRLMVGNGDRVELFGPDSAEHDTLDTGPVAGFLVDDAVAARAELVAAGVDSCTPIERARDGHHWFYFRAPDGNYYELCEGPRPPRQEAD